MIGTWTPPGAIFTVQFDDEKLELKLIKRIEIPHDEPISWMAFDVRGWERKSGCYTPPTMLTLTRPARQEKHLRFGDEEMVELCR